jgi:DNA end-binding protein Ku
LAASAADRELIPVANCAHYLYLVSLNGMARPISRGVLSFGLVSIPVELYSAIEDHNIRFHLLHKKCGSRVRNQLFCPVCKVVIERDETVRGYEVSKGQYVRVEDAELEALEAEANSSIEMREFIPIEKVDPIYFESTYYYYCVINVD